MRVEFQLNWDGATPGGWTDYTDFVEVTAFKKTISLNADNDPQKSVTAEIEAFADAYLELKANLIDSASRYSNFYVIQITDTDCGDVFTYFKVEDKSLRWCDNGECRLQMTLLEYHPELDCMYQTLIADNTSGEFQSYPASGYIHPRFRYCDVVKPTFFYYYIIYFSSIVSAAITAINIALFAVFSIITWVVNLLGGNWTVPSIGYGFAEDILGCNRGHPAPLLRTYIDNVCNKCGLSVTNTSMPIIYAETIAGYDNPYYYSCLMTGYTKKGVDMDGGKDYIPNNQPSWTLNQLLSKIKLLFNARWLIYSGVIYFERKDLIGELVYGSTPTIDLSGADAEYLLDDVCYEFNGRGKPKNIIFKYGVDATDKIGNELLSRFNGWYEDTSGNKNYNETIEINAIDFGAAGFVMDGQDSAYDAAFGLALSGIITGTSYESCLKIMSDTFSLPKLIIWNKDTSISDARAAYSDYDIYGSSGADIYAFSDDDAAFLTISSSDCHNFNFPYSFDPDADNIGGNGFRNLWQFHEIDKPDSSLKDNIDIRFKLENCCRYTGLNLYQKVLLQDGATVAEIKELDFDRGKMEINVKCKLV